MQRGNTYLLGAVGVGIAIMTIWRVMAEELPAPPNGGTGGGVAPAPVRLVAPPPEVPVAAPRVVVEVIPRESYAPLRGGRVVAVELPGRTPLPTAMLAGTGASPWGDEVEAGRAGSVLVAIEVDGGRLVRLCGVRAAEVAELELGAVLGMRGTVRDERQQPVAGARVWFGALDAEGAPREVVTEADGAFEAAVRASRGVPMVVRAEGFASTWQELEIGVDSVRERAITLTPEGVLVVQLAGQADAVELGRVLVAPGATRSTELSRHPFFLQTVFGGAAVDGAGRATLRGLPQRGEVAVHFAHPQVALDAVVTVRLQGEQTESLVPQRFVKGWSGRVVDEAGAPVIGAGLLVRPGGRTPSAGSALTLLPPWLTARGCFYAAPGPDGAFRLGLPDEAGSVLSVRAPGRAGRDLPLPIDGEIVLPVWVGGELALRVEPPAAGQVWHCHIGVGGGLDVPCDAGEAAVVALPHAGRYDFRVATFVGEEKRGEREYLGVSVTGPVLLAAPKPE